MAATIDVLLVAEDAALRASLRRAMTTAGLRVVEADDGVEALARLDLQHFGIVVLSLWTPGFTTNHVVEYMRATANAPDVLILPEHPNGAALPGLARVEAYVPGPMDPDELVGLAVRMHTLATRTAQPHATASGTYARTAQPPVAAHKRTAGDNK